MKTTTIRFDEIVERSILAMSEKPTTAMQTIAEVFHYSRLGTLAEIRGRFTREEIIALADSFNGLLPTWSIMCNPKVFAAHTEDAEIYQASASMHNADIKTLVAKLEALTVFQSTILQLELLRFWNTDGPEGYGTPQPDLEKLIEFLS